MPRLTKNDKLKLCRGCRSHFYNGNNPMGINECWSLKSAKLVKRVRVGLWERPPWRETEIKVLDCYSEEGSSRSVYMTLAQAKDSNRACRESMARQEVSHARADLAKLLHEFKEAVNRDSLAVAGKCPPDYLTMALQWAELRIGPPVDPDGMPF